MIDETRKLILEVCRERQYTVAVAESCTGGLIGGALTDIPGSTAYFLGGVVVYSNLMKQNMIHVPAELLEEHGSVSEPVAIAMATGVREATGATWALSATGIAGPAAEGTHKPVGLVYIGCAGPDFADGTSNAMALKNMFDGDRDSVRQQTVQRALNLLLERIGELDA